MRRAGPSKFSASTRPGSIFTSTRAWSRRARPTASAPCCARRWRRSNARAPTPPSSGPSAPMQTLSLAPHDLAARLLLAIGLAVFLGLTFEEVYKSERRAIPGGIRSFPMLTLAGAMLLLIEPSHALAFVAGLPVLALWLYAYRRAVPAGGATTSMMIPASNLLAYVIGAVALLTAAVGGGRRHRRRRAAAVDPRAAARPDPDGAARRAADGGQISYPDRHRAAVGAAPGGDGPDAADALRLVARGRRGVHAVLRQLSAAALSAAVQRGAAAGAARRHLFLDRDDGRARQAAARGRSPAARHLGRHRRGHRDDVSAYRRGDRRFPPRPGDRGGAGLAGAQRARRRHRRLRMARRR